MEKCREPTSCSYFLCRLLSEESLFVPYRYEKHPQQKGSILEILRWGAFSLLFFRYGRMKNLHPVRISGGNSGIFFEIFAVAGEANDRYGNKRVIPPELGLYHNPLENASTFSLGFKNVYLFLFPMSPLFCL